MEKAICTKTLNHSDGHKCFIKDNSYNIIEGEKGSMDFWLLDESKQKHKVSVGLWASHFIFPWQQTESKVLYHHKIE